MSGVKHAPGPWEYVNNYDKYGKKALIVGHSDNDDLPVVCGCLASEADGLLIAAAPELLAALQCIVETYGAFNNFTPIRLTPNNARD